jgi:hypothetical protein
MGWQFRYVSTYNSDFAFDFGLVLTEEQARRRHRRQPAQPTWTPFATTPADPSYPGAHSTVSAAAATILAARYGDHVTFTVTSPTLPGAVRSFDTFHAAATEAGLSRIYAGIHTGLDHQAGLLLGAQIGQYTSGTRAGQWTPARASDPGVACADVLRVDAEGSCRTAAWRRTGGRRGDGAGGVWRRLAPARRVTVRRGAGLLGAAAAPRRGP